MDRDNLPQFPKGSLLSNNNILKQSSSRKIFEIKPTPHIKLKFLNNDEHKSTLPPILKQFQDRSRKIQTETSNYKKLTKNFSTKKLPGKNKRSSLLLDHVKDSYATNENYLKEEKLIINSNVKLNLETIKKHENILLRLLEITAYPHLYIHLSKACEELWELVFNNSLIDFIPIFQNEKLIESIKMFVQLELIGIAVFSHITNFIKMEKLNSFIFYTHQNYLLIVRFLANQINPNEKNSWIIHLKESLRNNTITSYLNEKPVAIIIKHNEILEATIKCIIRNCFIINSKFVLNSLSILKNVRNCEYEKFKIQIQNLIKMKIIEIDKMNEKVTYYRTINNSDENNIPIKGPFLPEKSKEDPKYTLVLDLDETLVHFKEDEKHFECQIRPYAPEFLKEMSKFYELAIFTAGLQEYADWMLEKLDPSKLIKHRLYRQHTSLHGLSLVKDISKLGRDVNKIIIVDNIVENFQLHIDNGIFIDSWEGDESDKSLMNLSQLLTSYPKKKLQS